jgi:hypothetical protein
MELLTQLIEAGKQTLLSQLAEVVDRFLRPAFRDAEPASGFQNN